MGDFGTGLLIEDGWEVLGTELVFDVLIVVMCCLLCCCWFFGAKGEGRAR